MILGGGQQKACVPVQIMFRELQGLSGNEEDL